MALALCGYALQTDARGMNANTGAALIQMAEAWLVFYTAYRILAPGGVAELHFRWEKPLVAFLQNWIRKLGFVVATRSGRRRLCRATTGCAGRRCPG